MRVLHDVSNKPWTLRKQVMANMVLEPFDRLWTERLTDAEHNELAHN